MRIGVFGGSFDPVHLGHLVAAECCREQAGLDRVVFVPAAVPPHKRDRTLAPAEDRLAMLRLATGGHDAFEVDPLELDRGGVSWTVDTLAALAAARPGAELRLVLGPDALADLPTWREPERIVSLAEPLAFERESLDDVAALAADHRLAALLGADRLARLVAGRVRMPAIGIRASGIRERVAAGRGIRYLVPRAVEAYVKTHGLYRPD
ncbi:MAG: nicotinate-nucleotide adenylyltransferase [Planctomycetaceae bacterium]